MRWLATTLGVLTLLVPAVTRATWSIAAVDPQTGQVGVAAASCVPAPFGTSLLPNVGGVVPGVGAVAAQAQFSMSERDLAVQLLAAGNAPQDVLDMVNAQDPGSASRQYGIAHLRLGTAAFTGSQNQQFAGDRQGLGVTTQGNILVGPQVVDDALAAFEAEPATCPFTLADRLMVALEAGAGPGGDMRCDAAQSALAAFIKVAEPGDPLDTPSLEIIIASQPDGGDNPVALLRTEYDLWRTQNPPDPSGCMGGTTGGSGGSGDAGTSTSEAGSTTNPTTTTSNGSEGPATSAGDAGATDSGDDGCSCRGAGHPQWPAWSLVLVAFVRRRRRPARW